MNCEINYCTNEAQNEVTLSLPPDDHKEVVQLCNQHYGIVMLARSDKIKVHEQKEK